MQDLLTSTHDESKAAFDFFKDHCNGPRTETNTSILNWLRHTYPHHFVTAVTEQNCSLLDFAQAGHAEAIADIGDEMYASNREWQPVGDLAEEEKHHGRLQDDFYFVRYQYKWQSKKYIIYHVKWQDVFSPPSKMFYILSHRSNVNIYGGHCIETDALILACGKWSSFLHEEIFVFDDGHWDKSKELWKAVNGSSWKDVILDPETKKNLTEDVHGFFDNQQLYKEFVVPWKRGIIFHGLPGNGKTVSIRALMSSLSVRDDHIPSLYVKSFETCQGEQYSIRQIFKQARQSAPCLLIFEDLDSLVKEEVRSYFLNEVDGLESNDGILMIGSTNHLDRLDPAIAKRPSRFDRKYHFKLPEEPERIAYANYWRDKLAKNAMVDFPEELCAVVAKLTKGFSFAYLKELFVMALLTVARGGGVNEDELLEEDKQGDEGEEKERKEDEALHEATPVVRKVVLSDFNRNPYVNGDMSSANGNSEDYPEPEKQLSAEPEEPKKAKRTLPSIETPERLQNNVLLKVMKHQIRTLLAEMDNTDQKQWPSSKKQVGSSKYSGAQAQFARAMQRVMR